MVAGVDTSIAFAEVTEESSFAKRYFRTCTSLSLSLSLLIVIHVGETVVVTRGDIIAMRPFIVGAVIIRSCAAIFKR